MATQQATSRYFEDVKVDDQIPAMALKPTEVQLFCFSAVTWDTHRTHFDDPFSKNVDKLPGILVHGHLQAALLGRLATGWAGPRGKLARFTYQNRGMSIPGDTLTCTGRVTEKREENGKAIVACQVWIENQNGEITTTGDMAVELPKRG